MNRLILVVVFIAVISGCTEQRSGSDTKPVSMGSVEQGIYRNNFFHLNVPLPSGWVTLNETERKRLMISNSARLAGDDQQLKQMAERSDIPSMCLLCTSEKPLQAMTPSNPVLMIISEDVSHLQEVKRGRDYHLLTQLVWEQSRFDASYPWPIYEETIDSVRFDVMEAVVDAQGRSSFQKQYAAIINGRLLNFILIYQEDSGLRKLDAILQQVTISDRSAA